MHLFPGVFVTNHQKVGGLKQQNFFFSLTVLEPRSLKSVSVVQNHTSSGITLPLELLENSFLAFWWLLAIHGLHLYKLQTGLCSPITFSSSVCVSNLSVSLLYRHLGFHLGYTRIIQNDLLISRTST